MFFTPKWIASHLFVLLLTVSFIGAGLWQVGRLFERQDENSLVEERMGGVQPYSFALGSDPESLEYVRIQVVGSFEEESSILIANRSDEGTPGFWMWTNFVTDSGDDLLVNRGFIERSVVLGLEGSVPLSEADPTPGEITIEGLLRAGIEGGRSTEAGDQLSRPDAELAVDLLGLDPALDASVYLELTAQDPPRDALAPRPVPAPDLSEGPHRSYAFQWFTFALMGVIGYAAVLIRIHRGDQELGDVPHQVEPSAGAPRASV